MTHTAEFTVRTGQSSPVRAHVVPIARGAADSRSMQRRRSPRPSSSGATGSAVARTRATTQAGAHLADRAQGAHVRADRRDRRRSDDVAARADRRRAQLGLPLLLAARRDVHALRADERRVQRRGARVARLAAARRRRRSREDADPLRRRRANAASPSSSSTGCRATRARARCASATPRTSSSSSTSTAR